MEMQEITAKMSSFLALNQGAVKLYDEAISKVQDQTLKTQLQQFKNDHQHHVQELQGWFQQSGQQQMQPSQEFKNLDQVLLQSAKMAQGQDQVMQCMHLGEALVNAEYGEALKMQAPQEIKQVLQSQLQVEHAHLQAVEKFSPIMQGMTSGGM